MASTAWALGAKLLWRTPHQPFAPRGLTGADAFASLAHSTRKLAWQLNICPVILVFVRCLRILAWATWCKMTRTKLVQNVYGAVCSSKINWKGALREKCSYGSVPVCGAVVVNIVFWPVVNVWQILIFSCKGFMQSRWGRPLPSVWKPNWALPHKNGALDTDRIGQESWRAQECW